MTNNIDNLIKEYLTKEYQYHVDKHGKNQIFGTFLVGTANYGFGETLADLHFITVYIPTFEQLCTGEINHNGTASMLGSLLDIRIVYNMAKHHDVDMLELLFSNNYIITPKYKNIYETDFRNNRDVLSQYNRKERMTKTYAKIQKAIKEENMFECARLGLAARLYCKNTPCDECYHINDDIYQNYLWSCKHGTTKVNTNDILKEIETLIEEAPDETNFIADSILKKTVVSTITAGLQETVSLDAFETCLTSTELKAWETLKTMVVDGTISISISKIIEDTGISRPVWKNLLLKLENNKIAKVDNQGVKGTLIQLL